jgi:hypothetical protein
MKKKFSPKDFKTNNFGNNFITMESLLSADFKNQTDEQFKRCLSEVQNINKLLVDKSKCDNEEHYKQVLALADTLLTMTLLEKRML